MFRRLQQRFDARWDARPTPPPETPEERRARRWTLPTLVVWFALYIGLTKAMRYAGVPLYVELAVVAVWFVAWLKWSRRFSRPRSR
jgi:hypothetical protein